MKWLADENFRNAIIRGVLRRAPSFDILRAQDIPQVSGEDDDVLLDYATAGGRTVVRHGQLRRTSQSAPVVLVQDSLQWPPSSRN